MRARARDAREDAAGSTFAGLEACLELTEGRTFVVVLALPAAAVAGRLFPAFSACPALPVGGLFAALADRGGPFTALAEGGVPAAARLTVAAAAVGIIVGAPDRLIDTATVSMTVHTPGLLIRILREARLYV